MSARRRASYKIDNPPIIVVFGITGDLSKRKLLPALYHLLRHNILPSNTKIIGVSRKSITVDELLNTVELCVLEKDKVCDPIGLQKTRDALETFQLDPTSDSDFKKLKLFLDKFDRNKKRERLLYMSTPADAYSIIVEKLGINRLNDSRTKILLEKPFGHNIASAEKLMKTVHRGFQENQIYRIDHYLAKETAQNLLSFRMNNPMFESLWDDKHIKKITIKAYEAIGIEKRANFYEKTGALRDLIQSHLIQLLCIALMDIPKDLSSTQIHQKKLNFMKNIKNADPKKAIRGQYKSYGNEVSNPSSRTETFAQIELQHNSKNGVTPK
jgi:glucose-6-phosphate 1-dehydrogenase